MCTKRIFMKMAILTVLVSAVLLCCGCESTPPPDNAVLNGFLRNAAEKQIKEHVAHKVATLPRINILSYDIKSVDIDKIKLHKQISRTDGNGAKISAYPVTANISARSELLFTDDDTGYLMKTNCTGSMNIHAFINEVGKQSYIIPDNNDFTCNSSIVR